MHIQYRFTLADGTELRFALTLDDATLALVPPPATAEPPAWTALTNQPCPNCPLAQAEGARCPVAVNLDPVIQGFHDSISHDLAEIAVETEARTYLKRAPLQAGISGIIGLIMVTSGCPVMDRLRPMVRTHIPFATLEETTYRALSMYLLSQYFVQRRGGTPNWDLSGLMSVYGEVRKVNKAFVKRLHTLQIEDASLNAIVNLDVFASFTSMSIAANTLDEVEALFSAYLTGGAGPVGDLGGVFGAPAEPPPMPVPEPAPLPELERRAAPSPIRDRSPMDALGRHLIWEPEDEPPAR